MILEKNNVDNIVQPVTEASYANIPIVAFCNIDSPTKVCII